MFPFNDVIPRVIPASNVHQREVPLGRAAVSASVPSNMFKVLLILLFVVFFFIFLTISFVVVGARTLFEVMGGE